MLSLSLSLSLSSCLVLATLVSGTILASTTAKADDSAVDDVNITVPISCSMTGTGNTTHNAEINNGTYEQGIGTTTLKVFCNDSEGFAIYANGYTNQEDGNNLLINNALANNNTIATGIATSGDTSNWAMKLTKKTDSGDTTTTPLTIDSAPNTSGGADASFENYHIVPTAFTKVAHKNSSTDMTTATGGATLETTYAAYINQTQSAGTYSGKVKYVLVHPSTAEAPVNADQVGVTYNGNGLTFASGGSKNRVIYKSGCTETGEYIGNTPTISKTPNVNNDGTATSGYAYNTTQTDPVTIAGASKLKVELQYGIENNFDYLYVFQGTYSGEVTGGENAPMEAGQMATYTGGNGSDDAKFTPGETATFYVTGDTVTFAFFGDDYQDDGYYGYYAKVYPVYTTEQPDTTAGTICSITAETGTYAETTTWKGKWYITSNNETTFLADEAAVINYLEQNSALLGTNVNIYAYNPYTIIYNGNNATAGTMTGFTTKMDTTSSTADLMAPNFKRTGYGFAGWSEEANATVNSSSKIYGPNEKVLGSDLTFNSSTHETTLYAVWVASSGDLQGWSGCSTLNSGQVIALTDTRDNNVYTVGKMQDNNCWMMENLRLDNTATISSANTNSPISTFTALSATNDSWCTNSNAACYNQSMLNTNNINIGGTNVAGTTLTVAPGDYDGSNLNNDADVLGDYGDNYQWYGYGNYYNWYSATAGNGTYSSGSNTVAAGDICPTGWHLPNGGTGTGTNGGAISGGFSYLDKQMGGTGSGQNDNEGEEIVSNRWRSYPNNFIYSGLWYGSSASVRGHRGGYWSRTASVTSTALYLDFHSSNVYPGTYGYYKFYGFSVRCLAQ